VNRKQLFDYDVTCVIMGGGAGTRLKPLTMKRAKPAVPLGGKFRLIDIPISNCINSGVNRIFVLTQFNSTPLHRHINSSYQFHRFSRGFVEILAAQQTPSYGARGGSWYQGTADAVRKNLPRLDEAGGQDVLILSGDQIYQMDFRDILETHRADDLGAIRADVTLGAVLVDKERARSLGVLRVDAEGNVVAFVEKPGDDESKFEGLEADPALLARFGVDAGTGPWYLANMGIYVFDLAVLQKSLDNEFVDFGREVLPSLLDKARFRAHLFQGYWEDIGTVGAFHEANLDLASPKPQFNFYSQEYPVYTRARLLPASKMQRAVIDESLISDGCIVEGATISQSLLGIRSVVQTGVEIDRCYVMGADYYEDDDDRAENRRQGRPDMGIGEKSHIRNAIVDKNARIGKNVALLNESGVSEYDGPEERLHVRDGIIIVPRDTIVPDGFRF